jgi:tRNA uridine 5-carbamoylmethylation protein Kti12
LVAEKLNAMLELWNEHSFDISRKNGMDKLSTTIEKGGYNVVIVDDIMFYRSMRRDVYRIAREHSCGYVSIFINISLEIALKRNASRELPSRVAEEVTQQLQS